MIGSISWLLRVLPVVSVLACISDPHAPRLDQYQKTRETAISIGEMQSVFVSSDFFKGHRRHHELSDQLDEEIRRALQELGFRVAASPGAADYTLAAELRGWWSPSARFALITLLTLTVYTPLDYKWILDVHLSDSEGAPIGSAHERGAFRFETFGILFFPATMVAYLELVPPHWREIAGRAADVSADYLLSELASEGTRPLRGP
jgi:hypothetical protein